MRWATLRSTVTMAMATVVALALLACGSTTVSSPGSDPSATEAPQYPTRTVPGAFVPPGPEQRRHAVGSLEGLPGPLRRAFEEGQGFFEPVPQPEPGDWLAEHDEVFQTYDRYRTRRTIHPDAEHDTIVLLPLGEFEPGASPPLPDLARHTEAFFGMPVRVLPTLAMRELVELGVGARQHQGHLQLHAKDILDVLVERKPKDAWALAAVTMIDLYPDDDWNFVFGYASGRDQVGVFSFVRFDPMFEGRPRGEGFERHMLRRSVKTLSHEIGHMFGISHCTHFHCLMNGHNHEAEGARGPLHLCPVDLRKLHLSHPFDPAERLRQLAAVDRELGLTDEARWLERRLAWVETGRVE